MSICANPKCGKEFEPPKKRPDRLCCCRSCSCAYGWLDPTKVARRIANILAAKRSPQGRINQRRSNVARWATAEQHEAMRDLNRRNWADPEKAANLTEKLRVSHRRPEMREFFSESRKAAWRDPKVREKMIASMRAGKRTPEFREQFSKALIARWQDPVAREKMIAGHRRVMADPAMRERTRARMTALWATDEHREKVRRGRERWQERILDMLDDPKFEASVTKRINAARRSTNRPLGIITADDILDATMAVLIDGTGKRRFA